jgi:hypothetical protein
LVQVHGALALALAFTWLGPRLNLLPAGIAGLLVTGGSTVLLGVAPNLATGMAAMAAMGMGVVGLQVAFASYLQRETIDEYRGRVREAFILAGAVICLSAVPVLPLALTRAADLEAAAADAEAEV